MALKVIKQVVDEKVKIYYEGIILKSWFVAFFEGGHNKDEM